MAITFITGPSGSGKSYLSVYTIYNLFKNEVPKGTKKDKFLSYFYYFFRFLPFLKPLPPKYKYKFVYTNINEFNFDFHPNLVKLDVKLLKNNLAILRNFAVNCNYTDKQLIEEAKKLNLFNVLIVFDEVQDYLTKKDEVWLWWLTYHRHLHQDIHMMTQHFDQIPKEYLKNCIHFYKMPPPSMAIFSNKFTVSYYTCVGMTNKCRDKSFYIPYDKNVGNLYTSGDKTERKTILKKFLWIIPLIIFFMWFAYYIFDSNRKSIPTNDKYAHKSQNTLESSVTFQHKNNDDPKEKSVTVQEDKISFTNKRFIHIDCFGSDCYYNNNSFSIKFLFYLIAKNKLDYVANEHINSSFVRYDMIIDNDLNSFLNRSFKNSSKSSKKKRPHSSNKSQNISLFGGAR